VIDPEPTEGNLAMNSPGRIVPPGSTPLRELAHAIAGALTLPNDVADLEEVGYLRASRDRARVVLFAMRRIIADHEIENDPGDVMAVVATIRECIRQPASEQAADPPRANLHAATGLRGQPDIGDEAADAPEMIP
jgi:hypothetical protein